MINILLRAGVLEIKIWMKKEKRMSVYFRKFLNFITINIRYI